MEIVNFESKLTEDTYFVRHSENINLKNDFVPWPIHIKKSAWSEFYKPCEKKVLFFTGFDFGTRAVLWEFLGEAKFSLTIFGYKNKKKNPILSGKMRCISVEDQFFLFLIIFRRNLTYQEAGWLFGVSTTVATNVFKTWLNFLYFKFKDMKDEMFTRRQDLPKPLPRAFRNKLLRNTRIVIDCTEIQIEGSSNFNQQGNMYSNYKHRQTAKILIGVTPAGAASFVSDAYEGSISDREITKKSGVLNYIENGDTVLADRGFTIDDLIMALGGKLVIPPFLKGRSNFTFEEESMSRIITKARIHVERFNERFKNFRFVTQVFPHYHLPLISQAVYVACMFANFTNTLAK